jgi:sec-independent protein translocase protein TatA
MPNIGPLEIVVILIILLVIFGPRRIPELGRSVGQGMRNFKESVTGRDRGEHDRELEAEAGRPPASGPVTAKPASPEPVRPGSVEADRARESAAAVEPTREPRG